MATLRSFLARVTRSRQTALLAFAVSLGALLLSAGWFTAARGTLAEAFGRVGQAEQDLALAQQRLQEAELRVQLAERAKAVADDARASGFVKSRWGERLINVAQAPMPREDVHHLIGSVARDESRIFGAEAFELSVSRPDEGLFDVVDPRSPPLLVTMRGTLLFRTEETP